MNGLGPGLKGEKLKTSVIRDILDNWRNLKVDWIIDMEINVI